MADIFISYARSTATQAKAVATALRALGYSVWIDDDLPAHRTYSRVIEEQMAAAKAAVVIWSADAVQSEWVMSEANRAREDRKLVQLSVDAARLPMPFDQIQSADLVDWAGDPDTPGWRKVVSSIADLVGGTTEAAQPVADAPLPLPSKPSIAVLPFANLSGDPEQEYFADGMVAEIVTALSRHRSLFVVGSASTLAFRGETRTTKEIARELGVRYLLEGNVRRSGDRVRIAAQLIDAVSGGQLWAEKFDGVLNDVFDLQDEVATAVATQIEPNVLSAEMKRASSFPTADTSAYDLYLRARYLLHRADAKSLAERDTLIDCAIAADPDFAPALALASIFQAFHWISDGNDADDARTAAIDLGRRALRAGGADAEVLALVVNGFALIGEDLEFCQSTIDRALAINPGLSVAWLASGLARLCAGQTALALDHLDTGLRQDPRSPWSFTFRMFRADCIFMMHRFEEAAALFKESVQVNPDSVGPRTMLVAAYAHLGRLAEAEALCRPMLVASLQMVLSWFHDPDDKELLRSGLRLAGADV